MTELLQAFEIVERMGYALVPFSVPVLVYFARLHVRHDRRLVRLETMIFEKEI